MSFDDLPRQASMFPQADEDGRKCLQLSEITQVLKAVGSDMKADAFEGEDHFTIHLNTANAEDPWITTVPEWISK